jgi:mannose-6-phosphate isomerase-like protein (cupin superfamily)
MTVEGKAWGETRLIRATPFCEVHAIRFLAGTHCSRHHHRTRWNGFLVTEGRLRIVRWCETGLVTETLIGPGDWAEVAPGIDHRFDAMTDGAALEIYWPDFGSPDIARKT